MGGGEKTRGACVFCGRTLTRGGLVRHLAACPERQEAIERANQRAGKEETLYHLQVQEAWYGDYWLHLEMRGSARLGDLDDYLRAIWLECCGHLSQFSIGGWEGDEIPQRKHAKEVFEPGLELTHIYDFGTSSFTTIKVVGMREGKPLTPHPIVLMARNDQPEHTCIECGKPATCLCMECLYEEDEWGTLCDEHAETHPHTDYEDPVPLINSPRVGMCGYCGPAEPPY